MKPQIGQSKLTILKHAPSVYRKRRPIQLRRKHSALLGPADSHSSGNASHDATGAVVGGGVLRRTGPGAGLHHHPPSLLRRQTTRQRSFMDLDLPSLRALRREPSMMELDPPPTLFAPAPNPTHFAPGPWAFFQAAEAQREQTRAQMEFLTKLQELRLRDEQAFVQLMAGFAKECPVQFGQLTGFMRRMETDMEMGAGDSAFAQQQLFFQQQQQMLQQQQQHPQLHDLWSKMTSSRENNRSKTNLLALAQVFGNQVYSGSSHRDEFQGQHHQQFGGRGGRNNGGGRGRGHGHGRGRGRGRGRDGNSRSNGMEWGAGGQGGGSGMGGGQPRIPNVPSLRRGKTFQQQQQALQQLTAYQRHLYQQVQHMNQQKQQQRWQQGPGGLDSGASTPMAHELMRYAAMLAGKGDPNAIPPLLASVSSPSLSSAGSGSVSPTSPVGFGSLMTQMYQHQHQQQNQAQQYQQQFQQQQQQHQRDPLELAAANMQMNMGSSRRSRYKPPPVRTH